MARVSPDPERLSQLLSCYLDGALTPAELDDVVFALDSDLDAIAEFRKLKEARRAVRLLPMLEVPVHLLPTGHLDEELSAFLDGELATTEIPVVTGHLETCDECRMALADLDRSRIAVRALPGVEPPEFLESHRETTAASKRRIPTILALATGVAAVVLAFTVGPFGSDGDQPTISIADLDARHAAVASVPAAVQVSNTSP
ncbi:MAG: zf-HC2 domain-containing protein [Actinomycetota bacterium]